MRFSGAFSSVRRLIPAIDLRIRWRAHFVVCAHSHGLHAPDIRLLDLTSTFVSELGGTPNRPQVRFAVRDRLSHPTIFSFVILIPEKCCKRVKLFENKNGEGSLQLKL